MLSADPVQSLERDHVRCSSLVRALRDVDIARANSLPREQFVRPMEELRDELFTHFAREEEGLFPFVLDQLPGAKSTVDRLVAAHDAICGSLSRLIRVALRTDREVNPATFDGLLKRFFKVYAEHAATEVVLLAELNAELDADQRTALRELIQGL